MKLKIGFSTGCFYRELSVKEALKFLKDFGIDVAEFKIGTIDDIKNGKIDTLSKEDLAGFRYLSLHAPVVNYGNNDDTKIVFKKINELHKIRKLDMVVFHPDTVEDFSVFENLKFPVGFENMDNRKKTHRIVGDMENLLKNKNFDFVLDVNHIYSNDRSLKLGKEFYSKLGNRIKEIHLSGYKELHDPLFETKQREIIDIIQDFDIPIINESTMYTADIKKEWDYMVNEIDKIIKNRK